MPKDRLRQGRGRAYAGAAPPRQPSVADLMEEQRQAFIAKFGRAPGPDDPVIFDPDHDTPREIPERKVCAQTVPIMLRAGTPEHLIYAYLRTGGLVLTASTLKKAPPDDRAAWKEAMAEYEKYFAGDD